MVSLLRERNLSQSVSIKVERLLYRFSDAKLGGDYWWWALPVDELIKFGVAPVTKQEVIAYFLEHTSGVFNTRKCGQILSDASSTIWYWIS